MRAVPAVADESFWLHQYGIAGALQDARSKFRHREWTREIRGSTASRMLLVLRAELTAERGSTFSGKSILAFNLKVEPG